MASKVKKIFASIIEGIPPYRLVSIDALRGFDMFWIVGGATFFVSLLALFNIHTTQFEHAAWHGFTFWDLIFPLFVFIMGISMTFSINKRLERGENRKDIYKHIVIRTLILILLGLIYNGLLDLDFAYQRYAGVLQRIALCYFFSSIIVMNTKIKGQIIWTASLMLFYWGAMMLIPVPGVGAGVLTPSGNLSAFIDQKLLPGTFCCYEFGDNEGILSTIPAISTALLGALTGHWLQSSFSKKRKALGLMIAGIASLLLGLLWNLVFPINKLIWTSSYVLYSAGWSLLLLCLFYWLIDVQGWQSWSFPFVLIGLNPITIYMASALFDFSIIAKIFIHGFMDEMGRYQPLFLVTCTLIVKWYFLYFLYKHKIFLKV